MMIMVHSTYQIMQNELRASWTFFGLFGSIGVGNICGQSF